MIFFIKAGKSMHSVLFHLFDFVWRREEKLEQWRIDTLIQLHKRGSKDDFDNYRHIHTKPAKIS